MRGLARLQAEASSEGSHSPYCDEEISRVIEKEEDLKPMLSSLQQLCPDLAFWTGDSDASVGAGSVVKEVVCK